MKKIFVWIYVLAFSLLTGAPPVDVSLVVIDFKYNANDGVKVCEVQPLRISKLSGYYHTHQENPDFVKDFLGDWFDSFHVPKWAEGRRLGDLQLKQIYHEKFTIISQPIIHLQVDSDVLSHKGIQPADPYDLDSYTGMMYFTSGSLRQTAGIRAQYPSIVFIDAALLPLYGDKLQTDHIFDRNNELAAYRPHWGVYEKKYDYQLASRIRGEIGSDTVVIKPRHAAKGYGVIIVESSKLDSTLNFILHKSDKLKNHGDPSYSYWYKESSPDFIVEEFIPSDPILMDGKYYDPTYRCIALLSYTKKTPIIELIDGYAKLPSKAVTSSGSLNDRHKSCGTVPYYGAIREQDYSEISDQVADCLYLLYSELMKD